MIEYYGWISLRNSTYENNENEMNSILNKLTLFISEHEFENSTGFIKIHKVNGCCQLLFSGNTNHYSQDVAEIFELYQYVAKISQGSYGLLYVKNDESSDKFNEFEVYVLARGKIKKENDQFLSPCIPKIEDD
ncbi:Imm7 family immunity protein [Gilliamella sp. wkB308]|uniref:Imm7 family immunity protein n=1 Tax=Gilliamella sp. wkB308 TaxID=3120263 RepID=UPI00080DF6E5|nr:Imm7 family immunity protein [Gilliamella apicola]OCG00674.1 hypothetical protein A9G10_04205 [Gilliamella apicola]